MDPIPSEPISPIVPAKKSFPIGLTLLIILILASLTATYFLLKPSLAPQPAAESTRAPANWKVFSDGDKGIEFQYPDTWTVQTYPGPTAAVFLESHPFEFGLDTATVSTTMTINFEEVHDDKGKIAQNQMIATVLPGQKTLFDKDTTKVVDNFMLGNKQGAQISGVLSAETPDIGGTYSKRTFIPLPDTLMTITLKGQESEVTYDQILTTFKFLNPGQLIPQANTYTNPVFNYTIQFPSNYEIPPMDAKGPIVIIRKNDQEEAVELDGFDNSLHATLDDIAKDPPALLSDVLKKGEVTRVKINGLDAIQIKTQSQTFYILTNGQKIIEVTVNFVLTEELQSIVNSFTFKK